MLTVSVILALLAAIAAVVLAFIFITPEKKREKLSGFGKLLHDIITCKFFIIEKILQALYIFATAFTVILGVILLFYVQRIPFASINHWYGGYGIALMILGPIIARVIYELAILLVSLVKNVTSINRKLKSENEDEEQEDVFAVPDLKKYKSAPKAPVQVATPVAPAAPVDAPAEPAEAPAATSNVCSNCGAVGETGIFCTKCGAKLK
ncbi:MAG: hypothetical protein J5852_04100 [Clostridia bacterium]|nr:hypothetical protein [Clostridia bacterium]